MTVHLWRNQYLVSNSAELLFSLDIPRGPKTCSNPNQNLGVWFHRVMNQANQKLEKLKVLKTRIKKRFFNSRNLKFFKAQKLENVESFSNHQTRIDKNRLPMPWNRYTRRTPDNVSADDMSLKRDVPQIGTDGQWPYDRVPRWDDKISARAVFWNFDVQVIYKGSHDESRDELHFSTISTTP